MENQPLTTPPVQPKSNRRLFLIIGIIVLGCLCIACVIGVAAFYYFVPVTITRNPSTNLPNVPVTNTTPNKAPTIAIRTATPVANKTSTVVTNSASLCEQVLTLPDEGAQHLSSPVQTPTYKSNPPTSGTHNPEWLNAGIYSTPQDLTKMVHSLEHGYIVIYYRDLAANELAQLVSLVRSSPIKIIVNPYPQAPARVVLTAWAHMQKCNGVDQNTIAAFVNQFRDEGPEKGAP